MSFKGNCKKISSETNGNDDEADVDAMNGDNNDDRDDSDNDSIVMDFVGKKGNNFVFDSPHKHIID